MPKMKTHKSLAKRLKKTGKGKLIHFRAGASHLMRKKSKSRKRRLAKKKILGGRFGRKLARLLGG